MSVLTSSSTTGAYSFNPSAGNLALFAYSMINMRPPELGTQHMIDAAMAANFAMVELSNSNPMQFAFETLSTGANTPDGAAGGTFATSAATSSGNTLTFATSPAIAGSVNGFYVSDSTNAAAIAAGTTVVSVTGSGPYTVTLSANVVGPGVGSGDAIVFGAVAPVTQGTAVYTLPARTLAVSIATIVTGSGQSLVERVLGPISDYQYQALPNKNQQAAPTSFFLWLGKPPSAPTFTLWPTPDGGGPYGLNIRTMRQLQDVDLANGQGIDSPYRFLGAFVTNMAGWLAEIYKPEKADRLYMLYERRMQLAQGRDQETVPLSILPGLSSYYQIR